MSHSDLAAVTRMWHSKSVKIRPNVARPMQGERGIHRWSLTSLTMLHPAGGCREKSQRAVLCAGERRHMWIPL